MNVQSMVNNPYGQSINGLWRGSENRKELEIHIMKYFKELYDVAVNGIDLIVDGNIEQFNVVFILVTYIGLLEKLLGKCSSTAKYGCFWCDKTKNDWDSLLKINKGKQQMIKDMVIDGNKGIKELRQEPDHKTSTFKKRE